MNIPTLQVVDIVAGTSVDGPGLRTSIYIAGCRHKCPGCHNPQTWDFNSGNVMTIDEVVAIVEDNGFNVTITGGDPLYSLPAISSLIKKLHQAGYTIWLYTGFKWEEIIQMAEVKNVLENIEAVVDGPFELDKRDISLFFRGSTNQRIINVRASLSANKVIEFDCYG